MYNTIRLSAPNSYLIYIIWISASLTFVKFVLRPMHRQEMIFKNGVQQKLFCSVYGQYQIMFRLLKLKWCPRFVLYIVPPSYCCQFSFCFLTAYEIWVCHTVSVLWKACRSASYKVCVFKVWMALFGFCSNSHAWNFHSLKFCFQVMALLQNLPQQAQLLQTGE